MVALKQQDYPAPNATSTKAWNTRAARKTPIPIAVALANLGEVAHLRGDLLRAQQLYQESLTLKHEMGDKRRIAIQLEDLAKLAVDLGALRKPRACSPPAAPARSDWHADQRVQPAGVPGGTCADSRSDRQRSI